MALVVKDRVQETTTTIGTGTVTLGGAVLGFQTFATVGDGNTTYYTIVDLTAGDWEVGIGTYTSSGTTLSRTTVLSSSNAGSLVPFAAGTKNVFVTYPSSRSVYLSAAGLAVDVLDIGTLGTSTANITTANITAGTVSTTPTNNTDIVNKAYADAIASGIHFHEAVAYATTAALPANTYNNGASGVGATLTANANGALTVDGHTFTSPTDDGTRILVKNEAAGANNGVYTLSQAGNSSPGAPYILTRATDFDTVGTGVDQIDEGDFFLVTGGTANINTAWVQQTAPPITIGTTAIVFQQFSAPITYTAGTGLSESPSYTFNIADVGTAGTYGSASSVPVFITNAQGQVTSVTNTGIAIAAGAVSGLAASATTDTTNASNISSGTLGTSRLTGSYTGITGTGALAAGSLATGFTAVSAPLGGTGQTSYAVGDLIYADTTTSLAKLADVAVGNALISGGVGAAPSWGKIGMATHVSGTLPIANGGTNTTATPTNGGVTYGTGTAQAYSTVGTSGQVLRSNGAAAPTWLAQSSIAAGSATNATFASSATNATFASSATNATFASSATNATQATNLNSSNYINQNGSQGSWNADFQNTPAGTARYSGDLGANTTNGPGGSWWMQQNFRHTNASNYWGTQVAWGWEDNANRLATRNVQNGSFGGWVYYLNSSNYTSYAPSTTGSGASGTWGINVTGSAGSATNATFASNAGNTNSVSNAVGTSFTWTGVQNFTGNGNTGSSSGIGMSAFSTGGNGAIMAFHRAGAFAVNFGLDSDNVMRIGGWSAAANRWQLDMSGNNTLAGTITATNLFGQGQTWQDVTASRAGGTTYTNSTSRPITVLITCTYGASNNSIYINSFSFFITGPYANSAIIPVSFVVPPGSTYRADNRGIWLELR